VAEAVAAAGEGDGEEAPEPLAPAGGEGVGAPPETLPRGDCVGAAGVGETGAEGGGDGVPSTTVAVATDVGNGEDVPAGGVPVPHALALPLALALGVCAAVGEPPPPPRLVEVGAAPEGVGAGTEGDTVAD
jgi:hypothetical protein